MSALRPGSRLDPAPRASRSAGAIAVGAAAFAAAEFGLASLVGGFFLWPRAEAMLFLAFRPWLLLVAALLAARGGWRSRFLFYAAALGVAAAGETILLLSLGAGNPFPEMLRGLAGGAGIAVLADAVVQLGRRLAGRLGAALGFAALAASFAAAGALRPYEALVLGPTAGERAGARPPLLLMTALPLVWGEGGAFDPNSRPDPAFTLLEREFEIRPIDAIEPQALAGARLMLLAQPRLLAPEELVALDAWVREGGRALILTDPRLGHAGPWRPGDVRRPPDRGLLGPLLDHWGIRLEAPGGEGSSERYVGGRRLLLHSSGSFVAQGPACRVAADPALARCRIGGGEAMLVADADLLAQPLWAPNGGERHAREADNPLVVADWLDSLAGLRRERVERPVEWKDPRSGAGRALLAASVPALLALLGGFALLVWRGRASTTLSTGSSTVNKRRTEEAKG